MAKCFIYCPDYVVCSSVTESNGVTLSYMAVNVPFGIQAIGLRVFPCARCTILHPVSNLSTKSLLYKFLPLAKRLLFPAPPLGSRRFPILLQCADCTAFTSILRRSSSIVAPLIVLITLLSSSLFSLLIFSHLLNFREFLRAVFVIKMVPDVYGGPR